MAKKSPRRLKEITYHHGNLRESLLKAALKFLKTNPLETLSLRGLALSTGVSQSAPYRHFKNRNELLAAISQQGFEIKFNYLLGAFNQYQDTPQELFHQFALAFLQMGIDHPQHFKLMMTSPVLPCDEYPELLGAAASTYALVKIMVEAGQKAGVIGAGDPYHKALHCWTMVSGFTMLYTEGRLDWLGMSNLNAASALRILTEQSLEGYQNPLKSRSGRFSPFGTDVSKERLILLKSAEKEIRELLIK